MVNAGVKKKSNKIRGTTSDRIFDVVNFIIALLALLIVLIPLLNVVASSFSSGAAVQAGKVGIIPVEPTLDAYIEVFQYGDVWIGYRNTIYYTVVGTLLNIVFTVLMAYPLARADLKGRGVIMKLLVFTMMFSGGLIPNYLLVKDLNLLNTPWALWLPGLISVYNVIVMRTFFQTTIPKELLEAAPACAGLTPTQLRRFQLFVEGGKSFREIAQLEQCEYSAARKSVTQAKEKIKKFLKRGCSKREFLSD